MHTATLNPIRPSTAIGPTRTGALAARRLPVHVYRRRRLAALLVAISATIGVFSVAAGVLAGPGGVTASASGAPSAGVVDRAGVGASSTVVVLAGDTMWSIAHRHRGAADHHRFLEELIRINGGPSVRAGQLLVLP